MKYSVVIPIKVSEPWQIAMTRCALDTLRLTTETDFELVIVECLTDHFKHEGEHIQIKEPISPNAELNIGIEAAQGEFVIYSQNDLFMRPGWLEALADPFDLFNDCGISTLAAAELAGKLPFPMPSNIIAEGIYGPLMMFRKGWDIDAQTFPCQFGDSDLIARVYASGLRSYRNYNVVIQHLNRMTTAGKENDQDFKDAKDRFIAKHGKSPLLMVHALMSGQIV